MKRFWTILVAAAVASAQNIPVPPAGAATLSIDEYNRLVALAAQAPESPATPPFAHVLKSARLNLHVKGGAASGSILIEGEVLTKSDRKVPLVSGMIVTDAKQNGRNLPLMQEDGAHVALLPGSQEFAVTLEAAIPLTVETGRASFNLPAPVAGAAQLTLTVPGDHTLVNLSPGLITRRSSHDGHTVIEATLVPGQPATLWWASRATPQAPPVVPKETRFLSNVETLISVSEGELAMAALMEVTVVQGDPAEFTIRAPEGYELTGASGPTLASSETQPGRVVLKVENAAARSHQFLVSFEREFMAAEVEIPLVTFEGTQRETGEVLIEGDGAIELSAEERGGLRRMDLKETNPYLRSMARSTLQTAFRYQKRPAESPAVALAWTRFPDSRVLSAVAQYAQATTLITSQGRSLTEIKLTLRNQAQPFMRVELPPDATILSAEVAGEKVKPVIGADGNRVPLLRANFRPSGPYEVSYVFLHAGTPFDKKGLAELRLPGMDIPIGRVAWEVFVPDQFRVSKFAGDATPEDWFPPIGRDAYEQSPPPVALGPGTMGGRVLDPSGAFLPGTQVEIRHIASGTVYRAVAGPNGSWTAAGLPSGRFRVVASLAGFKTHIQEMEYNGARPVNTDIVLEVGAAAESITVTAEASVLMTESAEISSRVRMNDGIPPPPRAPRQQVRPLDLGASANVTGLQQRVAGVLPISVSVPRTGVSYRFLRPLVVNEETTLTFNYKRR